jgi:hypothetical protein
MERLDPDLERLVAKARKGEGPSADDRRRVDGALARRLGAAAVGAAGALAAEPTAAATALASTVKAASISGIWAKAAIVITVGGAVALFAVPRLATRGAEPAKPPAPRVEPPALAIPVAERAPEGAGPVEAPVEPAPIASAPKAVRAAPSLSDEVALLSQAQTALRAGSAEQALTLLSEHARRFPRGELRAERSAARVAALCQLRRPDEARREGAAFLRQWPGSPLAAQVRSSCAGGETK